MNGVWMISGNHIAFQCGEEILHPNAEEIYEVLSDAHNSFVAGIKCIPVTQAFSDVYFSKIGTDVKCILENNDSQLIFLRFRNPSAGIWTINVEPVQMLEGEFHIWLPVEEFLEGEVYFLEANPDTTLTEPGTSRNAMTVAYYNGRENGVDINSGRGYTRDGLIKPDYAVPGVEVTGAGLNGSFVTRTGSSVATGIAAGAAALLMEWILEQPEARGVNSSQIRNIILLGTDQRAMVEYPNREWGYGTMNLFQSLDTLRRLK